MNPQFPIILGVASLFLVLFVFVLIYASRYIKVGPNEVLIVSGRKIRLPDGRVAGVRIVKGGGTFVFPVVEKADALTLEIINVDMPGVRAQVAGARAVQADCTGQVKVNGDDASILAAAQCFLNKSPAEMAKIVQPILEKHLNSVLGSSSINEVGLSPAALATKVQTSASADLDQMGLSLVNFTIRDIRTV